MSVVKKCARCGLQSSHAVNKHVTCSACGAGFPVCERCVPTWTVNKCPSCGMFPANARWQVSGGSSSTASTSSNVGGATPSWKIYEGGQENRKKKREEAGPGMHHGVSLPVDQVSALRVLEDLVKAEIKPAEPGKPKTNVFVERDGNVVELYIAPTDWSRKNEILDTLARVITIEGLGFKGVPESVALAPLQALPSFTCLVLGSRVNAQVPARLTGDLIAGICSLSRLEELNISFLVLEPADIDNHLPRLTNLRKLNVSGIRSSQNDQFPKNLGAISSLEELDISRLKNSMGKAVIPSGLEKLPSVKIVHMDADQNGLGILWGKLKTRLQENNPAAYPKQDMKAKGLGFLKGLASGAQSPSDKAKAYKDSLPDVLKQGWSGIAF